MAKLSDLRIELRAWLVNLIRDAKGWITVEDLVQAVGLPQPVVNQELHEERNEPAAIIEVGRLKDKPAYRYTGTGAECPPMPADTDTIQAQLGGGKKTGSTRKAPAAKAPAKKQAARKKPAEKAPAKKSPARASTKGGTSLSLEGLPREVAALLIKAPHTLQDLSSIFLLDAKEIDEAIDELITKKLAQRVPMETDEEENIVAPTRKLIKDYQGKLDPQSVLSKYEHGHRRPARSADTGLIEGGAGDLLEGLGQAEYAVLLAAGRNPGLSRVALSEAARGLLPDDAEDATAFAEAMLDMTSEGLLRTSGRGRQATYRLSEDVSLQAIEAASGLGTSRSDGFLVTALGLLGVVSTDDAQADAIQARKALSDLIEERDRLLEDNQRLQKATAVLERIRQEIDGAE